MPRRLPKRFNSQAAVLLASISLLSLTSCQDSTVVRAPIPITDGFHKSLPAKNNRIVVWGTHPSVTNMAITWLQKRGLTVVERARLKQVLDEQTVRLTHTQDDEAQVLKVGKLLGADMVVFLDASASQGTQANMNFSMFGGAGANVQGLYTPSVSVRGVDVETSEVTWTGHARYAQSIPNLDDALARLTCQALATAWSDNRHSTPATRSTQDCDVPTP